MTLEAEYPIRLNYRAIAADVCPGGSSTARRSRRTPSPVAPRPGSWAAAAIGARPGGAGARDTAERRAESTTPTRGGREPPQQTPSTRQIVAWRPSARRRATASSRRWLCVQWAMCSLGVGPLGAGCLTSTGLERQRLRGSGGHGPVLNTSRDRRAGSLSPELPCGTWAPKQPGPNQHPLAARCRREFGRSD
jgi:hypothetical protein